jgi:hypothetical protein
MDIPYEQKKGMSISKASFVSKTSKTQLNINWSIIHDLLTILI